MKKVLLVIAAICSCAHLYAQEPSDHNDGTHRGHHYDHIHRDHRSERHGVPPFAYIGFSTGFNNAAGAIGFDFDIPVNRYLTIGAGGGFSTWGNKLHVDGKYFLKRHQRGWAIGGGLTVNSGDNHYRTRPMNTIAGTKEMVYLDLHTQRNVFFAVYHYWNMGRRYNRFFTELGWSIPVVNTKFVQLSGDPLTQSSIDRVNRLAPGGLIVGIGFSFGLHH